MITQQTDMSTISTINDLRDHIQIGYELMVKYQSSIPYDRACAASEKTIKEMGYSSTLLYMDKKFLDFVLDRDPQLESQKLKPINGYAKNSEDYSCNF